MVVAGGNAIMYTSSMTLDLRKLSIQETDPIKREEGIKVGVTIKKNHCSPSKNPYVKVQYYAMFGQGIEQYLETLENAVEQDILEKGGAWIKEVDPETGAPKEIDGVRYAWQGKEAFRNFCIENPDYFKYIQDRLTGKVTVLSEEEVNAIEEENATIEKSLPDEVKKEVKTSRKKKTS